MTLFKRFLLVLAFCSAAAVQMFAQSAVSGTVKDLSGLPLAGVVVMEEGKIIEVGTPKELLDKQGKFAKLWNLQA